MTSKHDRQPPMLGTRDEAEAYALYLLDSSEKAVGIEPTADYLRTQNILNVLGDYVADIQLGEAAEEHAIVIEALGCELRALLPTLAGSEALSRQLYTILDQLDAKRILRPFSARP